MAASAVLAAVTWLAGCGNPDGDGEPTDAGDPLAGLVVLAGDPGAATLLVHDGAGTAREVPLPTRATAWVSAGRTRQLVATLADGTLRLSDELRGDQPPAWSGIPADGVELPAEPLYFATWSPNGGRIAAIAADFGAGSRLTVAIVGGTGDASLLLPVPRIPVVAPPAWLDDERLLVQARAGFTVVDTATGDLAGRPGEPLDGGVALAIAAGESLVALERPSGGAVEVRDLDRWLGGETGRPMVRLEGQGEVGALAFDRRAERLAVVWQQPNGPGTLVVYVRAGGWREGARLELPGESARAVVDWLP